MNIKQRSKRIRVAVIDTGIDPDSMSLAEVVGGIGFQSAPDNTIITSTNYYDNIGHGTACASVISRDITALIELLAVRIIDDAGISKTIMIEEGIRWALNNDVQVINISLGAETWQDEIKESLRRICIEAQRCGTIIIVASGPEGVSSIPAILDEVITVGTAICSPETIYVADEGHVDFLAKGDFQRIPWQRGHVLIQGSSLAAAHVTRKVCKIIAKHRMLSNNDVKVHLRNQAVQGDQSFRLRWRSAVEGFFEQRSHHHAKWIHNAVVYPFNKEIQTLVRFHKQLSFDLHAIIDPPAKGLVGQDAGLVIGAKEMGLTIKSDLQRALDEADTLILGHTEAMQNRSGSPFLSRIIETAIKAGKHIYSLSPIYRDENQQLYEMAGSSNLRIQDPTVKKEEVDILLEVAASNPVDISSVAGIPMGASRLNELKKLLLPNMAPVLFHDCPVLAIFGTSRSQGKFSLQLALRTQLSQLGYKVSHFATEPTGALVGASAMLPIGYEGGVNYGVETWGYLSRLLITEIKNHERPELLILGGQSGVASISPTMVSLGFSPLLNLALGLSTQPDGCILVCNLFDELTYIQRCISVVESVFHTRVIALAFNDFCWEDYTWHNIKRQRRSRVPVEQLQHELEVREAKFDIPCRDLIYIDSIRQLAQLTIEYFSSFAPDEKIPNRILATG